MKFDFDPGFDITPLSVDEGFRLGADCFDKGTEFRKLDSVRKSLRDPNCDGPENVYAIMMDSDAKDADRLKAAFDILDRAGFRPDDRDATGDAEAELPKLLEALQEQEETSK